MTIASNDYNLVIFLTLSSAGDGITKSTLFIEELSDSS
jgi:hypothetical protein